MTTLANRPATALLVVDVQNDVVAGAFRRDTVLANIARLVDRARRAGTPVIWVRHHDNDLRHGSHGWQIATELSPADDEPIIDKTYGDAFEATPLERALADRGVGRLIVTGAETDACVRSTLHGAFVRGYDVTLVADAHTAGDKTSWGAPPVPAVIDHTNLYWSHQAAPDRVAAVVPTDAIAFADG
ncbi:isochorismatase family protein [Mycolicibacterium sp. 3033]|nr:isochorismatase family protein [Mycolicibacterium aurantiacum]